MRNVSKLSRTEEEGGWGSAGWCDPGREAGEVLGDVTQQVAAGNLQCRWQITLAQERGHTGDGDEPQSTGDLSLGFKSLSWSTIQQRALKQQENLHDSRERTPKNIINGKDEEYEIYSAKNYEDKLIHISVSRLRNEWMERLEKRIKMLRTQSEDSSSWRAHTHYTFGGK